MLPYDPNGLVTRWSGAARPGTLLNIAAALATLTLVAFVLTRILR